MEMFFEKSEEGIEEGLSVIDGEVVVLPNTMKVPHMGWNQIEPARAHTTVTEGDEVMVKCLEVDPSGKIRLSRRAALAEGLEAAEQS